MVKLVIAPSVIVPLVLAVVMHGCSRGGESDAAGRGSAAAPGTSAPVATQASSDTTCRKTGLWSACSFEDRLEDAGFVPLKEPEPVRREYLSVAGTSYRLGADRLIAFIYSSAEARELETARLDTATAAPTGVRSSWDGVPVLIISNNMLAILLSRNERQIERVQLALTAGLPATP